MRARYLTGEILARAFQGMVRLHGRFVCPFSVLFKCRILVRFKLAEREKTEFKIGRVK